MTKTHVLLLTASAALIAVLLISCGGQQVAPPTDSPSIGEAAPVLQTGFPVELPTDGVQPWETVGTNGAVVPATRGASTITLGAEFVSGVDMFLDGGSVAKNNGVLSISSGPAGSGDVSYAIYRLVLGGQQPGVLGLDINLRNRSNGTGSEYYVGLADYASSSWKWHGPISDGQARLVLNGDMLSPLGNVFAAIVAYNGADIDVVGLGVDPADELDTTAPDIPTAPLVTPVDGGLALEWLPVAAGDLAGYNIYYSPYPTVIDDRSLGATRVAWVEGTTRHVITGLTQKTYIRMSAVDISGNESFVCPLVSGEPLTGTAPALEVTVDKAVGLLGDSITLSASGADLYDFDLDGDGIFELTGEANGTQIFNVDGTGIIRPAVRGTSGTAVALGAVSLIITGNSRPVARLYADPAEGPAPLTVDFTSEGEDFDGSIEEYAWDFNGDGIYDTTDTSPTLAPYDYVQPGLFNAKLRVTDDKGAVDVDTVAIFARQFTGFDNLYIDQDQDAEIFLSWAMINGHPAVAFHDTALANLQYSRALDSAGRVWGDPVTITPAPGTGLHCALAEIDGRPALAWYDGPVGNIQYTISDDAEGKDWNSFPVDVGPSPSATTRPIALAEVAGNPAVCWVENATSNLHYRRATGTNGTGESPADWADPIAVIDNSGAVAGPPSLAVIDGNPAVAYYHSGANEVQFKRAINATGALVGDWPVGATNVSGAITPHGSHVNLVEANGNPAVTMAGSGEQALLFLRALDAQGTAWPVTGVEVEQFGSALDSFDTEIINGVPAIAFQGLSPMTSIWFVQALDADGADWQMPQSVFVETFSSPGQWTGLLNNGGVPNIVYYEPGVLAGVGFAVPRFE